MMITRCPHCGTAFRVTPEQLRLRQGRVRCGQCMTSFDALASLAEDTDELADDNQTTVVEDEAASVRGDGTFAVAPQTVEAPADERIEPTIEPDLGPFPLVTDQTPVPPSGEQMSTISLEIEPTADPLEPPPPVEPPDPLASPVKSLYEPVAEARLHEPATTARQWPWVVGCLLALMALTVQGTVHFRTALAARMPESRPWLALLCEPLGCGVDLPRRIDLIEIESSDLAPDKQTDGRLRLAATLRNRASFAQAWPHLELTLTSAGDRPLLRRALAPGEYLAPLAPNSVGFAAGAEQIVQLDLHVADMPAVGYRLYLFYP